VLEEKTLDLMTLLTAYTEENSPAVPVILRPPTPVPPLPSPFKAAKKKRKRRKHLGKESSEEGEIPPTSQQEPSKEPRLTRVQQKKGPFEGAGSTVEGEERANVPFWNPAFVLSMRMPSRPMLL